MSETTKTYQTASDFAVTQKAIAGKDIILSVFDSAGTNLLAIAGQQGLTINRSSDSIEVVTKDGDGWKQKIAGIKEWSIDNDGVYVPSDTAHKALQVAFEDGAEVCLKVTNRKTSAEMFGGMAIISDYPIEAPYDDTVTYSISFEGNGKLVDLSDISSAD